MARAGWLHLLAAVLVLGTSVVLVVAQLPTVADTKFSVDRGVFTAPFSLEITSATPGAQIVYTTNGEAPTPHIGMNYTGPIQIDQSTVVRAAAFKYGMNPTNVDTQTYIFPDSVLTQTAPATVYPEQFWTWDFNAAHTSGATIAELSEALVSLPIWSIVMAPTDLWQTDNAIMVTGQLRVDKQRACSLEVIYDPVKFPYPRFKTFQVDTSIQMIGGAQRGGSDHKQSFALTFKKEYGPGTLKQSIFQSSPVWTSRGEAKEYDRIQVRSGYNEEWTKGVSWTTFLRDQFARDTQLAMNGHGARGTHVLLFLNGYFWGLFDPSERPDHRHGASYLGGDKEDWFYTKRKALTSYRAERYNGMRANVAAGTQTYEEIMQQVDVAALCDWRIYTMISGLGDIQWYAYHRHDPPGPVIWLAWDSEFSWVYAPNPARSCCHTSTAARRYDFHSSLRDDSTLVFRDLLENYPEARFTFMDRLYRHTHNGGALTDKRLTERWNALAERIEPVIDLESGRWGDEYNGPWLRANWEVEVAKLPDEQFVGSDLWLWGNLSVSTPNPWGDGHPSFWDPLIPADLPPNIVPNGVPSHGGVRASPDGTRIAIVPGDATEAWYLATTYDGSVPEPRTAGIQYVGTAFHTVYPGERIGARQLLPSMPCQAESADDYPVRQIDIASVGSCTQGWTAMNDLAFYHAQDMRALRITEVMYNPPSIGSMPADAALNDTLVGNSDAEYIEIKNVGSTRLHLAGVHFLTGVKFTFPWTAALEPGALAVVARDPAVLLARYTYLSPEQVYGPFRTKLFGKAETLTLGEFDERVITSFSYDNNSPWPEEPQHAGHSLVARARSPQAGGSQDHVSLWRASCFVGGSPGRDDPVVCVPLPALPWLWILFSGLMVSAAGIAGVGYTRRRAAGLKASAMGFGIGKRNQWRHSNSLLGETEEAQVMAMGMHIRGKGVLDGALASKDRVALHDHEVDQGERDKPVVWRDQRKGSVGVRGDVRGVLKSSSSIGSRGRAGSSGRRDRLVWSDKADVSDGSQRRITSMPHAVGAAAKASIDASALDREEAAALRDRKAKPAAAAVPEQPRRDSAAAAGVLSIGVLLPAARDGTSGPAAAGGAEAKGAAGGGGGGDDDDDINDDDIGAAVIAPILPAPAPRRNLARKGTASGTTAGDSAPKQRRRSSSRNKADAAETGSASRRRGRARSSGGASLDAGDATETGSASRRRKRSGTGGKKRKGKPSGGGGGEDAAQL